MLYNGSMGINIPFYLLITIKSFSIWKIRPYPKHYVKGESKEDGGVVKVLKCFSVNINGRAVLNTDPPKEGHLSCMNWMR